MEKPCPKKMRGRTWKLQQPHGSSVPFFQHIADKLACPAPQSPTSLSFPEANWESGLGDVLEKEGGLRS